MGRHVAAAAAAPLGSLKRVLLCPDAKALLITSAAMLAYSELVKVRPLPLASVRFGPPLGSPHRVRRKGTRGGLLDTHSNALTHTIFPHKRTHPRSSWPPAGSATR